MSDQPRRNGGGRRRTQDEANLTHEEAKKKQKNREAAKKHREKKEKTLMALKKENEILEAKNEEYTETQRKLKEFIAQAEKLIQQHIEAGCNLPEELRDWKSSTDQSLQNNPVAMEQNSSDSCTSSGASPAVGNTSSTAQPPHDAPTSGVEARDPMALFSGESLRPIAQSSPRSEPRARQCSVSPSEKQTVGNPLGGPQLLLAHLKPSCRRHTVPMNQGDNQSATQSAQGGQLTSSSNLQQQSHQVLTLKAVSQPPFSSSGHSIVQQNGGQPAKTSVLHFMGKTYKVIYRENGRYQLVEIQGTLSKQTMDTSETDSSIVPDDRGSIVADASRTSNMTGNIPAAELLGDFEKTTKELSTDTSAHEDASTSYNGLRDNSWGGEQQPQYNYFINSVESTFTQQETAMLDNTCYSYTDDLNLSETPQHILRQIQIPTFQQQSRESNQSFGSTAYADSRSLSAVGTKLTSSTQVRGLPSVAAPPSSGLRHAVESEERTGLSAKTPVPCAPAILDMLSESEVLPSLQDEIKESLSSL